MWLPGNQHSPVECWVLRMEPEPLGLLRRLLYAGLARRRGQGLPPLAPRSRVWQEPQPVIPWPSGFQQGLILPTPRHPPRDIWQYLEILLVVSSGGTGGATVIQCIETRNASKRCAVHKMGPHHRALSGLEISDARMGQPCPSISVAYLAQEESQ